MDNLDRLSSIVAPLLNDPETMSSLRKAAEQMGLGSLLPEQDSSGENKSQPVMNGEQESEAPQIIHPEQKARPAGLSAEMLSAVTGLAPLLSSVGEDDTTRLLSALRPFLSQPRAKRLDEAERLLSLGRVLSIIKESKLI